MSFIGEDKNGATYAPGWFLADDEGCIRITYEFDAGADYVVSTDDGAKYVPMGSLVGDGIAYEDVDVTNGNMPGSLVTKGAVYIDRLLLNGRAIPEEDFAEIRNELIDAGFSVFLAPVVTRPDFDGSEAEDEGDGEGEGNGEG